jgi:hypothetical protein
VPDYIWWEAVAGVGECPHPPSVVPSRPERWVNVSMPATSKERNHPPTLLDLTPVNQVNLAALNLVQRRHQDGERARHDSRHSIPHPKTSIRLIRGKPVDGCS